MKADSDVITATPSLQHFTKSADFLELTKPRITLLVLGTTFVGFNLGAQGSLPLLLLFHTMLGTWLVAGGASAANMYVERHLDARMRRTERRPLPTGRLHSGEALVFALLLSLLGSAYLFVFVNPLTSLLSVITYSGYLFLYTPLKTKTWLCTMVGAIPGALPTTIGWAAINNRLSPGAWILFAIVFLWQLPHFYSIGWIYREDYARAGFSMLSVVDTGGSRTGRQTGIYTLALIIVSLIPSATHMAGVAYLIGALLLGSTMLACGLAFARLRDQLSARRLFMTSVWYLPILLSLLIMDKIPFK